MFEPKNPDYAERVRDIFESAPFLKHLGIALSDCGPGWCTSSLVVAPHHLQQDGVIHAGVVSTIADHTAGAAAGTLMGADQIVLTSEFKIHLLRAGRGDTVRCRGEVLRPGRTLTVVEAEVFAGYGDKPVAKLSATMALVTRPS